MTKPTVWEIQHEKHLIEEKIKQGMQRSMQNLLRLMKVLNWITFGALAIMIPSITAIAMSDVWPMAILFSGLWVFLAIHLVRNRQKVAAFEAFLKEKQDE